MNRFGSVLSSAYAQVELAPDKFQKVFKGDYDFYFHHLFETHKGEVVEACGWWVAANPDMLNQAEYPGLFFHHQMATSVAQAASLRQFGGGGTFEPLSKAAGILNERGRAAAAAGATFELTHVRVDASQHGERQLQLREGWACSLPELFAQWGKSRTATELYS